MKLVVPLTIPRMRCTFVATSASRSTLMTGIAAHTLASKRSCTPASDAAAKSSSPRRATSCLLAETTGLPARSRRSTWSPVPSTPPITSATTAIDGSPAISSKSVVSTPSAAGNERSELVSRTSARTTRSRWPVARSMSSAPSVSSRLTAAPTVPYPSSATGTSTLAIRLLEHARLGEPEAVVHRLHGAVDVARADQARDPDRRGRVDRDVDAGLRERVEHVRRDARVRLHPGADERDLRDLRVGGDVLAPDGARDLLQHRLRRREIGLGHRERDVRVPGCGDVLDDHVHVDVRIRERPEDRGRDARLVGDVANCHLRLRGVVRDARDDGLLHSFLLLNPGSSGI